MTYLNSRTRKQISRRTMLGAAATLAVTPALAEQCHIGPPEHQKGPLVFMNYDQVELDAAYDQSFYAPLRAQISARRATNSDARARRLGAPQRDVLRPDRGREARYLSHQAPQRAGLRLHPRRRLARRRGQELRLRRRDVRQCRRELCRARFHRHQGSGRRPARDGRPGAPRRRLGLQERRELRRRSEPVLCRRPFLRRSSLRRHAGDGLAEGLRRARRHHQGRAVHERHVRHEAGAALEARLLRQVRRRHGSKR